MEVHTAQPIVLHREPRKDDRGLQTNRKEKCAWLALIREQVDNVKMWQGSKWQKKIENQVRYSRTSTRFNNRK